MRTVCVQFQPERASKDAARIRRALRDALPDAEVVIGDDDGPYENTMFDVASPQDALSAVGVVFDSPLLGPSARLACIVTCQGECGWDDYLLLHHFDPTVKLDAPHAK